MIGELKFMVEEMEEVGISDIYIHYNNFIKVAGFASRFDREKLPLTRSVTRC